MICEWLSSLHSYDRASCGPNCYTEHEQLKLIGLHQLTTRRPLLLKLIQLLHRHRRRCWCANAATRRKRGKWKCIIDSVSWIVFSVSVDGFTQRSISQWLTTLIVRLSYWLLLGWLVQRFIGHLFDLSGSLGDVLGFFFQRSWGLWNESLKV